MFGLVGERIASWVAAAAVIGAIILGIVALITA